MTLVCGFGCKKGGDEMVAVSGGTVDGGKLIPLEAFSRKEVETVQAAAQKFAKEKNINLWDVKAEDIQSDPSIKDLGMDDADHKSAVETDLSMDPEFMSTGASFVGYKKIDFSDAKNPVLNYSVAPTQSTVTNSPDSRKFRSFKDAYKDQQIVVYKLKVTNPAQPPAQPKVTSIMFGPIDKAEADRQIESVKKQGAKIEIESTIPAVFFSNERGYIVVAVDGPVKLPHRMTMPQMSYYPVAPDLMNKLALANTGNQHKLPSQRAIPVAVLEKG